MISRDRRWRDSGLSGILFSYERLSGILLAVDDFQPGASLQSTGSIPIAGFTQTMVFGHCNHCFHPLVKSNTK
jgi:hypothetical protein